MAKLTREFLKQFGASGAAGNFGQFGSLAAAAPQYTKSPADIQALAAYLNGWQSATVGDNIPAIEDMNGLFYLAFYQLCYLLQNGIPEWDSSTTYYIGSVVTVGLRQFRSLTDDNLNNNPTTDTVNWFEWGREPVGIVKMYTGAVAPSGWLLMDDGTIGDASSGGTTFADAEAEPLFVHLWTNFSNTNCPVYDSAGVASTRGASAAADFAAHKRIRLPLTKHRVPVGLDASDSDFNALGKTGGAKTNDHTHTTTVPHAGWGSIGTNTSGNLNTHDDGSQRGTFQNKVIISSSPSNLNNLQPYSTINFIIKY